MIEILQNFIGLTDPERMLDLDVNNPANSPCHIYWKDRQGKYLGGNDLMAKNVGLDQGRDLLGRTDFDLCWKVGADALRNNDHMVMSKESSATMLELATRFNDSMLNVISHKMPLFSREGKIIGVKGLSFVLSQDELFSLGQNLNKDTVKSPKTQSILSPRQKDCLYYFSKGMTLKQIAHVLNLSPKTVEHYIATVKGKLNCSTRYELVEKAHQIGILKPIQ